MRNFIAICVSLADAPLVENAIILANYLVKSVIEDGDTVVVVTANEPNSEKRRLFSDDSPIKEIHLDESNLQIVKRKALKIAEHNGYKYFSLAEPSYIIYTNEYRFLLKTIGDSGWGHPFNRESLLIIVDDEATKSISSGNRPNPAKLFLNPPKSSYKGLFTVFPAKYINDNMFLPDLIGEKSDMALIRVLNETYGASIRVEGPITWLNRKTPVITSEKLNILSDVAFYKEFGDVHLKNAEKIICL